MATSSSAGAGEGGVLGWNMQFAEGDIVVSPPGWRPACYCILRTDPLRIGTPHTGLDLRNGKYYQLGDEDLIKVGTATSEFLETERQRLRNPRGQATDVTYQRGQARARRDAYFAEDATTRKRWEVLASAKPGDAIRLGHGCGHDEEVKFCYVVERGTKFVFVAENSRGVLTKYPLDLIAIRADQSATAPGGIQRQPRV